MNTQYSSYYPGVLGHITEAHARYYSNAWGFDLRFEVLVSGGLAEFMGRFDPSRDGLWVCRIEDSFAGSIAVDGAPGEDRGSSPEPPATRARLRWFLVRPEHRGRGIGSTLLKKALDFCRQRNYTTVYLHTFKGLEAARRLYESSGFRLTHEQPGSAWGPTVTEQVFQLQMPGT